MADKEWNKSVDLSKRMYPFLKNDGRSRQSGPTPGLKGRDRNERCDCGCGKKIKHHLLDK